jgi:hypothetical protein
MIIHSVTHFFDNFEEMGGADENDKGENDQVGSTRCAERHRANAGSFPVAPERGLLEWTGRGLERH